MRETIRSLRKLAKSKKPSDPITSRCDRMRTIVREIEAGTHRNPTKGKEHLVKYTSEILVINADGGVYVRKHHTRT